MSAANTDLFKHVVRKWVGQIGAAGVSNNSTTTIPLTSSTSLPTDTAIVATIDRVDSTGTATPSLEETVIGIVSGTDLVSCVRGAEGTAQAHLAGAVVEILVTAKGYNDLLDGILVNHSQLGHLKSGAQIDDTSADHQYVLAVSELTADRTVTLPLLTAADEFVFKAHTQTLTNKRVTKRTGTTTSSATPTINTDLYDRYTITALATAITSMTTNLSGTPVDGDQLVIRLKDDGTGRGITWGASFASRGATLPTTTTANKVTYVGLFWNSAASTWDCVAAITEA